jgi:hypothetical protein
MLVSRRFCRSFRGAFHGDGTFCGNPAWQGQAGHGGGIRQAVQAGALPVIKKMDGFKAYYLVSTGDDNIVAVSLFTNPAVAQSSTATLMPWIKENLGPLMASGTDPADGEVLIAELQ